MAQTQFTPPPTYADVVVVDETNQRHRFNPIWLDWFLSLAQTLTQSGAGTGVIKHNALPDLQGGIPAVTSPATPAQMYHLSTALYGVMAAIGSFGAVGTVLTSTGSGVQWSGGGSAASYDYQVPTTGFTITIPSGKTYEILNPAGTLATGTINMPASPSDGQVVVVTSTHVITALTVSGNGHTLLNAPTALQNWVNTPANISGYGFSYIYILSITSWVRLT